MDAASPQKEPFKGGLEAQVQAFPRSRAARGDCGRREEGSMADYVKVAKTNEIEPGQARLVDVMGKRIALFNVDGQFFAVDNTCTHKGGPLAEGEISGHEVTCPWHGATFDVRTGEVVALPAQRGIARYGVRVTGIDIEVEA